MEDHQIRQFAITLATERHQIDNSVARQLATANGIRSSEVQETLIEAEKIFQYIKTGKIN